MWIISRRGQRSDGITALVPGGSVLRLPAQLQINCSTHAATHASERRTSSERAEIKARKAAPSLPDHPAAADPALRFLERQVGIRVQTCIHEFPRRIRSTGTGTGRGFNWNHTDGKSTLYDGGPPQLLRFRLHLHPPRPTRVPGGGRNVCYRFAQPTGNVDGTTVSERLFLFSGFRRPPAGTSPAKNKERQNVLLGGRASPWRRKRLLDTPRFVSQVAESGTNGPCPES